MALFNCPECQNEISDRVKACPQCGYPFIEDNVEPQKVELTAVHLKMDKGRKKKVIISVLVIVIFVALLFTGYSIYNYQQEKRAEEVYREVLNEYTENINLVMVDMISSGAIAESMMNLTSSVWYNTIYEKSDIETDKYTRDNVSWEFNDDFNTSLQNLFSERGFITKSNSVSESQRTVEETLKKLQNPPEEFTTSYDTLLELYSRYQSLTSLAISPTGSLSSFNNSKNEKSEEFIELYKKLKTQLPQ